ncbi:MAG TPA: alpha-amylase family protein [Thermoleophilaceae bacterium]
MPETKMLFNLNRIGARIALAGLLGAAAIGALASPAHASRTQESVMQDDRLLIKSGSAVREQALNDMQSLGVDTVHSLAVWRDFAPNADSRTKPSGFDGSDPAAYPPTAWDALDDLVRTLHARGMSLILTPTGFTPSWAGSCGSAHNRQVCGPNSAEFGKFVAALGKRYSGTYHDENQGGAVLPAVTRWSIWNEANLGAWLQPQFVVRKGRAVPKAPHIYRALATAAIGSLQATGHSGDQIMLGELAPLGQKTGRPASRNTAPVTFWQEMLCLGSNGRPLTGSARKARGCPAKFPRFQVNAVSHHPYNRGGASSPLTRGNPGDITLATISRLQSVLTQGSRARRIPSNLPIYYTEFGFQTNPPDRTFGMSLSRQAEYINESDYIAYRNSRIASVAQYELNDEPNLASFQTGLRFEAGKAKPSYAAYRLPIYVVRHGSKVGVFGQVRPAPDGSSDTVLIENRSGRTWNVVKTIKVSSQKGYFLVNTKYRSGSWRLSWTPSGGGSTVFSRSAAARSR